MNQPVFRRAALVAVIACGFAGQLGAQQHQAGNERFMGDWLGALVLPGTQLRIAVTVSRDSSGMLGASVKSLDQGGANLPTTMVLRGDTVALTMATVGASYTGVVNASGDTIHGTFIQGGALPLHLARVSALPVLLRPQEPRAPFPYRADTVSFTSAAGVTLAGTLITPTGTGPFPAVVFVSGSGPQDRNEEMLGHKPFLVIADYLARRGIASLRYDDRGFGKSTGSFATSTSADFATDAEAAVHFLQSQPKIARDRVGILGHSEGALVAPIVAARSHDVAFLVLLAGPGLPGDTLMLLQRAAVLRASGAPAGTFDPGQYANRKMFEALRLARDSADAAARLEAAQREMVAQMPPAQQAEINRQLDQKRALLMSPWWRNFLSYDPRTTLRSVRVPVLALNGALDTQVPAKDNLPEIETALKAAGNRDYQVIEMPGLNHLFQPTTTGDPNEYGRITETFAPAALDTIGSWITRHFVKPTGGGRKPKCMHE